jgi:glycosyltransferase involved in cell wall biosynthesis
MACGCAIVVSRLASSLEWIAEGTTGLTVPPRDADALADAMLRFAHDPALRRVCGEGALAVARREAGFAANMTHVDALFTALTGGGEVWPTTVRLAELRGGHVGGAA